jgi:hypothetical protein
VERGVRQLLADKVSGNLLGIWLLVPEHLRLGTWDLLCGWTGHAGGRIEPRLGLQLIHEAALCLSGVRQRRALSQRGFELANGLPFIASDQAVHGLLNEHTVAQSQRLQVALGKLRRVFGHFQGKLLAIDPHRVRSYSKRQMRRFRDNARSRPTKVSQTFFALDPDTHQPICFTTASSSCTATQAAMELLDLAAEILAPTPGETIVLADAEHFSAELIEHVHERTSFELLVPIKNLPPVRRQLRSIAEESFTRRWAGFATAKLPYQLARSKAAPLYQLVQRTGERPREYQFGSFLSTTDRDEVDVLTRDYPKRWHVEEFFNAHQALGWDRAGTLNLHIRYGQMTMALIAQAVTSQLRCRIGEPMATWDAGHLATAILAGLEGDLRVVDDTIVVTYYNAPDANLLRHSFENLPEKLEAEGVSPSIPWLYDFKLDFRFR